MFFGLLKEYIEGFNDKFDVVADVLPCLPLLDVNTAAALRAHVREKLDEHEEQYQAEGEDPPTMQLIRWRLLYFKINKLLGAFDNLEKDEKLKLVNTIVQSFLWAQAKPSDEINQTDKGNLDDVMLIAVEILHQIKIYEQSVLNPINFMKLSILEYAMKFSPGNNNIKLWLMKIYDKLGLNHRYAQVANGIKGLANADYEKFGALKFSHFHDHGISKDMEQIG